MSIQDWGSIGELVAAIATMLTLVYLSLQIRANTISAQTESRLNITQEYRNGSMALIDPETWTIWVKGLHTYPSLPLGERGTFSTLMSNEALLFQGIYAQFENGQLERATYDAYLYWFSSLVSTPGGAYMWKDSLRPVFVPKMVKAVDERIRQGNLLNILEQAQYQIEEIVLSNHPGAPASASDA